MIDMDKIDLMIARMTAIRSGAVPIRDELVTQFNTYIELGIALTEPPVISKNEAACPTMERLYPKMAFMGGPIAEEPFLFGGITPEREDHMRSVMGRSVLGESLVCRDFSTQEFPNKISEVLASWEAFYVGYNHTDGLFISMRSSPKDRAVLDFSGCSALHPFNATLTFCIDPEWKPHPRRALSAFDNQQLPEVFRTVIRDFIKVLRTAPGESDVQSVDDVWAAGFPKALIKSIRLIIVDGRLDLLQALKEITI